MKNLANLQAKKFSQKSLKKTCAKCTRCNTMGNCDQNGSC